MKHNEDRWRRLSATDRIETEMMGQLTVINIAG